MTLALLRAITFFGRIFKWILTSTVFLLGLIVLVNLMDSELDVDLNRAPSPPGNQVSKTHNMFFFSLGFFAPEGGDPEEFGREDFLYAIHSWRDAPYATDWRRERFSGEANYRSVAERVKSCRNPQDWVCLKGARSDLEVVSGILLPRYIHLLDSSWYWEEIVDPPPQHAIEFIWGPLKVQPMLLSNIALDYARGNHARALHVLGQDISYTRKQLAGSNSILMFLIAQLMVKRDYLLLSEILSAGDVFLPNEKVEILQMAMPLDQNELPLGRVLDNVGRARLMKLRWSYGAMATGVDPSIFSYQSGIFENYDLGFFPTRSVKFNFLLTPLFKVNASANLEYEALKREKELWNARSSGFERSRSETDASASLFAKALYGLQFVRNPVGKVLGHRNEGSTLGFMHRTLDLDGFIKLVALKARWRLATNSTRDVPTFAASQKDLFDPYTGLPMRWNGTQIYFDPKDGRAQAEAIASIPLP